MKGIYRPIAKGSVTLDEGESTKSLKTIMKVCTQLCRDGILDNDGRHYFRRKPHNYMRGNKIQFYLHYAFVDTLDDSDKKKVAQMLADELSTYCFEVEALNEAIVFTFDRETELDNHKKLIKKSLSKVLRH